MFSVPTSHLQRPGDEIALILEADASASATLAEAAQSLGVRPLACESPQHCKSLLDLQPRDAGIAGSVVAIVAAFTEAFDPSPALTDVLSKTVLPPPVLLAIDTPLGDSEEAAVQHAFFGLLPHPFSLAEARQELAAAITAGRRQASDRQIVSDYQRREASLNHDERLVLQAVCDGKLNKQIARELGVSVRTIEQRRRRVFTKMDVASAAPLAERVAVARTLQRLHTPTTPLSPVVRSHLQAIDVGLHDRITAI